MSFSSPLPSGPNPGNTRLRQILTPPQFGNPELNGGGGWGIFNAVFGWQNSATYGSVISYNVYWIFVMAMFACMRFQEVRGRWPWQGKGKKVVDDGDVERSARESEGELSGGDEKRVGVVEGKGARTVE